jgi:predicted phage tail protein
LVCASAVVISGGVGFGTAFPGWINWLLQQLVLDDARWGCPNAFTSAIRIASKQSADNRASYAFGGVTNTAAQGYRYRSFMVAGG